MRRVLGIVGLLLLSFAVYLFASRSDQGSPYPDVDFLRDCPGATDRFVSYTPVLRQDHTIVVGPVAGADFGRIHFRDLDHDGVKETIVETQLMFDTGEWYSDTKQVYRYLPAPAGGHPRLELLSDEHRGGASWAQ